jgi:hypothetical protein
VAEQEVAKRPREEKKKGKEQAPAEEGPTKKRKLVKSSGLHIGEARPDAEAPRSSELEDSSATQSEERPLSERLKSRPTTPSSTPSRGERGPQRSPAVREGQEFEPVVDLDSPPAHPQGNEQVLQLDPSVTPPSRSSDSRAEVGGLLHMCFLILC